MLDKEVGNYSHSYQSSFARNGRMAKCDYLVARWEIKSETKITGSNNSISNEDDESELALQLYYLVHLRHHLLNIAVFGTVNYDARRTAAR